MKKLFITLAMLSMTLAGCQKPEVIVLEDSSIESSKEVFTASVEEFDAQTKTALAPGNYVVWSAGDRLAIFQGSTIADEYQLADASAGLSGGSFKWVAKDNVVNDDFNAGTELPYNVAFYPYSEGLILTGDMEEGGKSAYTITNVVLPASQNYAQNSFGNGAFPMVAVTQNMADHNLKFKNVGGAMKLQLKGNQVVKSIKVEGNNGEKLSGSATVVVYANNLTPAIKMSDNASTAVNLECGEGVQLNESEATSFFIAMPPVLFANGFTATVTDTNNQVYTLKTEAANIVVRSSILVMPALTLAGGITHYIDEYGVDHGQGVEIDGVVWAPVNCGYHATDYPYGKLYQWGRKYGQGYDGVTSPDVVEGPVALNEGQSESNKNAFFVISTDTEYDWLNIQNDALWNSGTEESPEKTGYDPCPAGWRVPTSAEFSGLYENSSSWTTDDSGLHGYWFSGSSEYLSATNKVFFPAAGFLAESNGKGYLRDSNGYYWASTPYDNETDYDQACYLHLVDDYIGVHANCRASGFSVRCVQE